MLFATPTYLYALLGLPVLVAGLAWVWHRRWRATAAWSARGLWPKLLPGHGPIRLALSAATVALAFAGTVLALAQPRWGQSEEVIERHGVDIVFVLDTSLSMATTDLPPNRLWVAQTLIRRMTQELPGHRIALVQAEGDGVAMVPLTVDAAVVDLVLDAVLPGSLPTPGTELAPAIQRALDLFPAGGEKHSVIVLLSDGEDHGAGIDAIIGKLKERGVVLHAIGVGTREGRPLEMPRAEPGGPVEYKKDESGQVVVSRLVEANLEKLAQGTDGFYLRAGSAATDPRPIVDAINGMEQKTYGSEKVSTLEERFQWPLALAIVALLAHLAAGPFRPES
jgi:Ca-activated chloride channel family protein